MFARTTEVEALRAEFAETRADVKALVTGLDNLAGIVNNLALAVQANQAAAVTPPAAEAPKAPEAPKAEVKDVRYRSAAAIARGHKAEDAIWAKHYAAAGVKRFADLTPAQQAAAKAEVRAAWDGIKGTRKTKVA